MSVLGDGKVSSQKRFFRVWEMWSVGGIVRVVMVRGS